MITKKILTVACFVAILSGLPAQEVQESQEVEETLPSSLSESSLVRDIDTSGHDELVAWCRVIGLDDSGDSATLKRRLLEHYGVTPSAAPTDSSTEGERPSTRIVIESAKRSEYFTVGIGTDEETMIRLSGDVILTVEESQRERTHRVRADTVVFNQATNDISALGNIIYTVDTSGREEHFTGDSLTFEVTDWTGVIFRGSASRQQEVDGQDIEFFFRGDSIRRSGGDVLILENGTITSHNVDDPDYALKADKIWITGPGEWGLLGATLYVGRVPVMWFPFYWKAGNDMFFNPVIGSRTRVGYFIQTTTYFLGQKEEDDGFSFLGFGDSSTTDYELTRDGLFLMKTTADPDEEGTPHTLKYILDYYTALGAYTGLYGDFSSLGPLQNLNFDVSVAVSRSVDDSGNIWFVDDDGNPDIYWNSSYLGQHVLPFRWGVDLSVELPKWSLAMNWYSDPYYLRDFSNRNENFDWLNFLLSEEGTDVNQADVISGMDWTLRGSWTPSIPGLSPWIQSLSLNSFRTSLSWSTKDNQAITGSDNPDRVYDPARRFFYPNTLIIPNLSVSARGGLEPLSVNRVIRPESEEEEEDAEAQDTEAPNELGALPDQVIVSGGDLRPEIGQIYQADLVKGSLTYNLRSEVDIRNSAISSEWNEPADIDFQLDQSRIYLTGRGGVNYSLSFWENLTGISGSTEAKAYYRTHSDIFGTGATIDSSVELGDLETTKFLWDGNLRFFINPLQGLPNLSSSSLIYSIDASFFTWAYSGDLETGGYTQVWLGDKEDFRKHEFVGSLRWTPGLFNLSFSVANTIPPLEQRHIFDSSIGITWMDWETKFTNQIRFEDTEWQLNPLNFSTSWSGWDGEVTLSQTLRLNLEDYRFENAESRIKFWGFGTRLIMDYSSDWEWDRTNYQWIERDEVFGPSELILSYDRDLTPPRAWRNRLNYSADIGASWDINLRQPTENVLTFSLTQKLHIFQFLDLTWTVKSSNESMYLYFEGWRNQLGITQNYNFFGDLLKSFNFFSPGQQDRLESFFNMQMMEISLVHHLRNWDATLEYSGRPDLNSSGTAYEWKSEFTFLVTWNPLPKVRQRTQFKDEDWSVDVFGSDS